MQKGIGKETFGNREIIRMGLPILLGQLAQTLITFVDTVFMGHVGVVELGAAMMAGLYYYLFSTLAWGFAIGIQIVVARRFGEENFRQVGEVFQNGLLVVLCLGLFLFLVMHIFTSVLLQGIISSDEIRQAAIAFMDVRHFGIIFVCFNFLFRSTYIGMANTKIITYTTLLMAVVNIFLDYSLIFGHFGFPEMGIRGAAMASVAAEFSAFVFFILYTLFRIPVRKYGIIPFRKFNFPLIRSIVKLSLPTMGQHLVSFGTWFLFFVMIEHMGELAVGISGIARSVYMLILVPVWSLASVANALTSQLIGKGKSDEVGALLRRIIRMNLSVILLLVAICMVIPTPIVSLFTDDAMLASASVPTLYVICFASLTHCVAIVLFEAASGTGNTLTAFLMELLVLVFYVSYIFLVINVLNVSIEVVWGAEILYAVLLGIVCYLYLRFGKWQRKQV